MQSHPGSTHDELPPEGDQPPHYESRVEGAAAPAALPPVRGREVLVALGSLIVVPVVLVTLVLVTLRQRGWVDGFHTVVLAALITAAVAACGCLALQARRLRWGWRHLGFTPATRSLWHLVWEIPLCLLFTLIVVGIGALVLGVDPGGSNRTADFDAAAAAGPLFLISLAVTTAIIIPAAEEVVFRRFLLDWLCTKVPAAAAVGLSAVAFALVHVAPPVMPFVGLLGACAAVLRLRHGTLYAPLALHAVNNGLVVLGAVSGLSGPG